MNRTSKILAALVLTTTLSGCWAGVLYTGAEAAKTLAQERSVGGRVDDNAISLAINDKFIQKSFEDIYANVDTNVSEGRVLLTGNVDKPEQRKDVERLTWEVAGVKEVINEVQVAQSSDLSTYLEDAYISKAIKTLMLVTKGINSVNYGVETVNGVVYLMGIAENQRELDVALAIARRASGVKKVISHVIFKDDPRRGVWSK